MNRRGVVASLLALCAVPSFAQDVKVRRIGFLSPDVSTATVRKTFSESLKRLGYEEGRNLVIEWRWGDGQGAKLPALAEELVRHKVELIVARTNGPIQAAKRATSAIPIVMFNSNHPVEIGLIKSLSHPGANVTGTTYVTPEIREKQVQLLKEMAPRTVRVAVPWSLESPRDSGVGKITHGALERAAGRLGMKLQYFDAARPGEVKAAIDRVEANPGDAILYMAFPLFRSKASIEQVVALGLRRKLVSFSDMDNFADNGGLANYGPDTQTFIDRTASYVDRILKGAKPADLPVEQPTKYNLVVNLKTAKAIGLAIPQAILLRADRVIE